MKENCYELFSRAIRDGIKIRKKNSKKGIYFLHHPEGWQDNHGEECLILLGCSELYKWEEYKEHPHPTKLRDILITRAKNLGLKLCFDSFKEGEYLTWDNDKRCWVSSLTGTTINQLDGWKNEEVSILIDVEQTEEQTEEQTNPFLTLDKELSNSKTVVEELRNELVELNKVSVMHQERHKISVESANRLQGDLKVRGSRIVLLTNELAKKDTLILKLVNTLETIVSKGARL